MAKGRTQTKDSSVGEDPAEEKSQSRASASTDRESGSSGAEPRSSTEGKSGDRQAASSSEGKAKSTGGAPKSASSQSVSSSEGAPVASKSVSKSSPADRKEHSEGLRPQRSAPKEKCTAKSKSTGKRCSKYPLKGQTVCQYHGGANAVSKAAGKRREAKRKALAQASRLVQVHGVDMDPIDHLLDSLYRASQLVQVYAIMLAEIDEGADEQLADEQTRGELGYEIVEEEVGETGRFVERFIVHSKEKLLTLNKHSEAQLHPFLVAYSEALRDRARFAKMAIDAGIAEMQTELVERQVDMAQEALEAAIVEMQLDKAARRRFVESYARNLREIGSRGATAPLLGAGPR